MEEEEEADQKKWKAILNIQAMQCTRILFIFIYQAINIISINNVSTSDESIGYRSSCY